MLANATRIIRCRSAGRLRTFLRNHVLLQLWQPRHLPQPPTQAECSAALAQLVGENLRLRVTQAGSYADHLAKRIGGCARDAYTMLYGCAGFAVLFAACGVAVSHNMVLLDLLVLAELLTLLVLFLTFRNAHRVNWHTRWLGLRYHAEFLRSLPLLVALDPDSEQARQAAQGRFDSNGHGGHDVPHLSALGGHHDVTDERAQAHENGQAALRLEMLGDLKQLYLAAPQAYMARCLGYARLLGRQQLHYHCLRSQQEQAIVHRVHQLSLLSFGATIVAVITHFWWHSPVLTIICTGVPAFAASLHGFLAQEESERLAASYRLMAHRLHHWLDTAIDDSAPLPQLQSHLAALVGLLMADVQDWHRLFDDKGLYHLG